VKASYWLLLALFLFLVAIFLFFGGWLLIYLVSFIYTFGPFFVFSLVAYGLSYLISRTLKKGRIPVRLVAWTILLPIFLALYPMIHSAVLGDVKEALETIMYLFTNPFGQAMYEVAWFIGFLFMTRGIIRKRLPLLHKKTV
jgi:membrane protease YdiL (CAAX protease family)